VEQEDRRHDHFEAPRAQLRQDVEPRGHVDEARAPDEVDGEDPIRHVGNVERLLVYHNPG